MLKQEEKTEMKNMMKLSDELLELVIGGSCGNIDIGPREDRDRWGRGDSGKNTPGGNEDIFHPTKS